MSGEKLVQLCSCNACRAPLGDDPVGSPNADGAYCSDFCAGHAGGTLVEAKARHRERS